MRLQRPIVQFNNLKVCSVFSAGMILGILIMCIGKSILLDKTGLFDEDILYRMKYMTVDSDALFCYILQVRMRLLIGFVILSTTYLVIAVRLGSVLWGGISMGVYLAALTIRYGVKGAFFALVGIFPQVLLYIPAIYLLWRWNLEIQTIMGESLGLQKIERKRLLLSGILQIAVIGSLIVLGCLVESYINPGLVKAYLSIL